MKKIFTLGVACLILLASCGPNKKEKTLAQLEQEQSTYSQEAKNDKLQSETLSTDSENLSKEAKDDSSKSEYEKNKSDLLESEADQELSKAANLNSEIQAAKASSN